MTDKNDVVIGIAASLYASRASDDVLRGEPNLEALAMRHGTCTSSCSVPSRNLMVRRRREPIPEGYVLVERRVRNE